MRRSCFLLLALLLALATSSCRRTVEKARREIRVEAIEKVERHGLAGVDAVVRVRNGSGYKLVLDAARIDLYYGDARVGDVSLCGGVVLPRHTTQSLATQWRIRISDPLALFVLTRKYAQGDLSQLSVTFSAEGRGGPVPINISRERMPVSEFLAIFGLTSDDVKKYLEP